MDHNEVTETANGYRFVRRQAKPTIEVVVGGQFGSEGKGHVTAQRVQAALDLGKEVVNIRVAGPNAGHCVINPSTGQKHAFRALPVGAAYGTDVVCAIAAGSEIDMTVLRKEMEEVKMALGDYPRLIVDPEATLLTQEHINIEQLSDLNARLGSTAKGIGAARAARIWRKADRVYDNRAVVEEINSWGGLVLSVAKLMPKQLNTVIIIEGTQGYGLGLHAGRYPQCTSSDCRALDFLAMAGISPWDARYGGMGIWIAARVYPIRVAGNSGPLQGETTWDELGLPEEHTTVTQKVRRVGEWDQDLIREAVRANGGGGMVPYINLALTMVDQKFPEMENLSGDVTLPPDVAQWVEQIEKEADCKVGMITTSPDTCFYL